MFPETFKSRMSKMISVKNLIQQIIKNNQESDIILVKLVRLKLGSFSSQKVINFLLLSFLFRLQAKLLLNTPFYFFMKTDSVK